VDFGDQVESVARVVAELDYWRGHPGCTAAQARAWAERRWRDYLGRAAQTLEGLGERRVAVPAGGPGRWGKSGPPLLTVEQVLGWADRHRERTGSWPTANSGPVADVPGLTWRSVDNALRYGRRGLTGGNSLARLLERRWGPRPGRWGRWTEAEDELVRTLPPAEAARRTGRTLAAVYVRRGALGLHDARRKG
jgi:hypothetical protein